MSQTTNRTKADVFFTFFMLGLALILLTASFEGMGKRLMGAPSGKFAFVFDPVESGSLADTLRSTEVFRTVFELGEQNAKDVCEHLVRDVVSAHREWIAEVCLTKPWVLVTHSTLGAALVFINGSAGVTSELAELLLLERFSDGAIDVYNGTKLVGYVQGYVLRRLLLVFLVWEPIGIGTAVDSLVQSREADMYEANGIPWRFYTNTFNTLKLVFTVFVAASSMLYLGEQFLISLLGKRKS